MPTAIAQPKWTIVRALAGLLLFPFLASAADDLSFGFLYSQFPLTLEEGTRAEALGPFYFHETLEHGSEWSLPPLMSYSRNRQVDITKFDFVYPILTYDRYGEEYRFQFCQWLNFNGGQKITDTNTHRFTLFPFYFQQRSMNPENNYTAVVPFYGRLKNRLFRDESRFVLLPLYVQSKKRDVITDNYLYPIFHLRHGTELSGWQFWPLCGFESKDPHWRTNEWQESVIVPGHHKEFVLWPIYNRSLTGLGTTNPMSSLAVLPFFSRESSPNRTLMAVPWPLGYVYVNDRAQKFRQWSVPWPIIAFARGEGKTVNRVFPIYTFGQTPVLTRRSLLWPLYYYTHVHSPPLDRIRARILFFLYSDLKETNLDTDRVRRRRDLWPFFTWRTDGTRDRLQVLALLETALPNNESIERSYSPLWSIWRGEKNRETGASNQSFLWNLYRYERRPERKKFSLLFGLFQYDSTPKNPRWRIFYVPIGGRSGSDEAGSELAG